MEKVVLVDEHDREIGIMDKLEAHEKGLLHRAVSILVYNAKNELLLQQRAAGKYHSPLLWTNTCCSHPRLGETPKSAAERRLKEEMGIDVPLDFSFSFTYKATFENGLTEHEFDHVFVGSYNENPILNAEEANAYKWLPIEDIKADAKLNPSHYTPWFLILLERI